VLLGATAPLLVFAQKAEPSNFPDRPIHLIVGFPPGGATDLAAREVGAQLSDALRQPVVVDNKPGAGSIVGASYVAKAPADGYTLLMGSSSSLAINQSLHDTLPYNPATDFVAVGTVGQTPGILAVYPGVPARDLSELVQLVKNSSKRMTYASAGNGTIQHLLGQLFQKQTGTEIVHVPYKGSTPALGDVVGGHVDMIFDVVPSAAPLVKSGKLRAIAVTTMQRSEVLPEVPTMSEAGVQGIDVSSWWGIVAPTGTPKPIVRRLSEELLRIAGRRETQVNFLKIGAAPLAMSADQFSEFLKLEASRWASVIKAYKIKMD